MNIKNGIKQKNNKECGRDAAYFIYLLFNLYNEEAVVEIKEIMNATINMDCDRWSYLPTIQLLLQRASGIYRVLSFQYMDPNDAQV